MTVRRWRDPRNRRIWEVTAARLGAALRQEGRIPRVLSFVSTDTPRRGHSVRCCDRIGSLLDELDDQRFALCLDAARHGGFVWVDPRDGELWWARTTPSGAGAKGLEARFTSCRGERAGATPRGPLDALDDEEIAALLDDAVAQAAA